MSGVDVEVFYDSDGDNATFMFVLPSASITFQMERSEEGAVNGSVLLSNFQAMCKQALVELKGSDD